MPMISIGVAAGGVKSPADVDRLLPLDGLSEITLGSFTLEPRDGNPGNAFWSDEALRPTSINSLGMPNPGIEHVREFLLETVNKIHDSRKTARVSVAGFSPKEYAILANKLLGFGIDEIELNFGCPNVWSENGQKRITSFDVDLIRETIERVYDAVHLGAAPSIAVKLSVYSDPFLREEVALLIRELQRAVQTVVVCNTFPNATGYDMAGVSLIEASDGFGGLAGLPLKYIALAHVRDFVRLLPSSIKVVGVGGIAQGRDVLDMELAGASGVQVGTAYFVHNDPRIFQEIAAGYVDLKQEQFML